MIETNSRCLLNNFQRTKDGGNRRRVLSFKVSLRQLRVIINILLLLYIIFYDYLSR
jgi:hypothetical protein